MRLVVPGKLMVAGEYAVLEAHAPALVVAVAPGLHAELWPGANPCLALDGLGRAPVAWQASKGILRLGGGDDPVFRFAREALATVQAYLGGELPPFALRVGGLPSGPQGLKLGLGGSAAATVAIVAAALAAHKAQQALPPPECIFKLAAIAHTRVQGGGSGADVAASSFGGWVRYTSFTPAWLLRRLASGISIRDLVEEKWPFFSVQMLSPLPQQRHLLAAFSGQSASTPRLLAAVNSAREAHPEAFQAFLNRSRQAVEHLVAGLESANPGRALAALKANAQALEALGDRLGVAIVTPALATLIALAEAQGAGAKSSGAGGGDCALALAFDAPTAQKTLNAWQAAGHTSIPLEVADAGVRITSLSACHAPPPFAESNLD